MAENVKLSFDDGYKSIEINGDPNKVIRINPSDIGLIDRLAGLKDKAKEITDKYGDLDLSAVKKLESLSPGDAKYNEIRSAADTLRKAERAVRELIDSVFEYPVSDTVFGDSFCISPAGGKPVYLNFIEAMFGYINDEIRSRTAASRIKIDKYAQTASKISDEAKPAIKQTKPFIPLAEPAAVIDINKLSPDEKMELMRQLMS
ncbi:MAG: hypothetical protein IJ555_11150 [Ruminococcus sp.]|nr:hypothetical protein [Ruminococcus sp.]